MIIEERKIALQATLNEIQNYHTQLNMMEQDAQITQVRHQTLNVQNVELEAQIRELCLKIVEKSDDYQKMISDKGEQLRATDLEKTNI